MPPPLVPVPPFFQQVLGQLQSHHHLTERGLEPPHLPGLGITLFLEPVRARGQEHTAPRLEFMRGHLGLAGHHIHRFAPQQAQHDLGLRPALQRAGTAGGASAPAGAPVLLVFSLISILLDDRLTLVYRPVQENRVRFTMSTAPVRSLPLTAHFERRNASPFLAWMQNGGYSPRFGRVGRGVARRTTLFAERRNFLAARRWSG